MTKSDFIKGLDFETAKTAIAKKLDIAAENISVRPYKSGNFKIDLRNASGVTGSLVNGASKACLITRNLNISKKNKTYSYAAAVDIDLKNRYGEYINKIGQINFDKNKFTFDTITDMKN